MCEEPRWNFPDNRWTGENGLDTSDMETFRKDPMASLAREICQNSIDAALDERPVRVEFSLFQIPRNKIPGINELTAEILKCYEYKKDSEKEGRELEALKRAIERPVVSCMRISDFNTTGITGVETNKKGTPFYNLTRGSGVSDKGITNGGSKGIGKFASFVVSTTNTVFYSTKTVDGHCGYLGISRLRSVPIDESDPELMTLGTGYFGISEKNRPVQTELALDKNFSRDESEYGTDVYLLGFNDEDNWQNGIIVKVLESFMVAILRGKLEVVVDGALVSASTVPALLASESFGASGQKRTIKDVRAQYELLTGGDDVECAEVDVCDGMSVTVYMKEYSQEFSSAATKQCVMVRYPYMKITHMTTGAVLPFSALCIIERNEINNALRLIENPQHTDWELKRLNEFKSEKARVGRIKKSLENSVKNFIIDALRSSSGDSTDVVGAGDFLPSQDNLGEGKGDAVKTEVQVVKPMKVTKVRVPKTVKSGETGESLEFGTGEESENGEEGKIPSEGDGTPNPNPYVRPEQDPDGMQQLGEGDGPALRKAQLSGMKYKNFVTNKKNGEYVCVFTSLYDEPQCDLGIRVCGEAADKYPIDILSATVDGVPCTVENGVITGLKLQKDKHYRIAYKVARTEMFASEVIVNAYR